MANWYYADTSGQKGPVTEEEVKALLQATSPGDRPKLVWQQGMTDWVKPEQLPTFQTGASTTTREPVAETATDNLYHPPAAANPLPANPSPLEETPEIEPGSSPLQIGKIIGAAFELTKRHFGMILAVGAIYLGISLGIGTLLSLVEKLVQIQFPFDDFVTPEGEFAPDELLSNPVGIVVSILSNLITQLITLFISLGVTRIGLNLVSGKHYDIGMIFGEGNKFLRAVGASILYYLMVYAGLILLVIPGIYLAIRFGQYKHAIVDRDLGVMEAFRYSSRLTQKNKMNLVAIWIVSVAIVLAGMVALCVGLVFAYPLVWVVGLVTYRWLQYGEAAARPGLPAAPFAR